MSPHATSGPDRLRSRNALLAGFGAAILFLGITMFRLEGPGVYYDELHQATGAFAYVGRPTAMFSFMPIGGVPLLNMSYTGAVKTAIYGLYLRVSGRPFSVFSWRMLGIVFSAGGLVVFCVLAGDQLPVAALALFLGLIVTDTNLLLQSRHDWGPAALGFLLRMFLIGLGMRQLRGTGALWGPFVLGFVVGFSIFEKLSSVVLLGPLAVILLASPRRRSAWPFAALAGVLIGALPPIAVNAYSLATRSTLLALTALDTTPRRSIAGYAANYLALGSGGLERRMIFESTSPPWAEALEALAMVCLLLSVTIVVWTRGRDDDRARSAGVALIGYLAVGVALPFLPHGTAEHHWILGTPFQYLAIALAAASLWSWPSRPIRRVLFVTCLAMLLVTRTMAVRSAFDALRSGKYSRAWDPSLSAAAAFAAHQPTSAIFIAANWGTATQVFCFANGRQNFVFEPFWHYGGPETLNPILEPSERQLVIAAAIRRAAPPRPGEINTLRQVTDAIFRDLAASRGWEEIPVEPSIQALRVVEIRVFRRSTRKGGV